MGFDEITPVLLKDGGQWAIKINGVKFWCIKHSKYFGKGKPTGDCKWCWKLWNAKNGFPD